MTVAASLIRLASPFDGAAAAAEALASNNVNTMNPRRMCAFLS
jgi:hypothetical protein